MANGILIIDKPRDWTSHDVVAKLRGKFHEKRIGHAGTLDPMATGVLPVFIGRATRAVEFAAEGDKEYHAVLRLGTVTDTQDITGTVLEQKKAAVTTEMLEAAAEQFRGEIAQIPPMYSAIKKDGKKLYELARKGIEVERKPRPVTIHALEIGPWCSETDVKIRVICSKGTYIRTLCHDIGAALGCGGTMAALRRTEACGFPITQAVQLQNLLDHPEPETFLLPVDRCFDRYPALTIPLSGVKKVRNGAPISWNGGPGIYRVYHEDGTFLMIGEVKAGKLVTRKSFFEV